MTDTDKKETEEKTDSVNSTAESQGSTSTMDTEVSVPDSTESQESPSENKAVEVKNSNGSNHDSSSSNEKSSSNSKQSSVMADTNTSPDKASSSLETTPQEKPRSVLATSIALLALVGVMGLSATGWWLWQQLNLSQEKVMAEQASWSQNLSQQQANLQKLESKLDRVGTGIQAAESAVKQQRLQAEMIKAEILPRLDSHNRRLLALGNTSREDWMLAEAEYLLRLAAQRQAIEGVSGGVAALVVSADNILREIDDADLYPVREALARELSTLKLAGTVDRAGLYARMVVMQERVAVLPELDFSVQSVEAIERGEPIAAVGVKEHFNGFLAKLEDFIRVSHDNDQSFAMAPAARAMAKARMGLIITQAQSALLQTESELFISSLSQIEPLLQLHFPSIPERQWLIDESKSLLAVNIAPPRVALNGSLNELRAYIDRMHKLAPVKTSAAASVNGNSKGASKVTKKVAKSISGEVSP